MSKVEEGGGEGQIDPPPRLRVTIFFLEASRVKSSFNVFLLETIL